MKVHVQKETEVFKPVTITLTFETKDELMDFQSLMATNVNASAATFADWDKENTWRRPYFTKLMGILYNDIATATNIKRRT